MTLAAPKPFGGKDLRVSRKSGASTYDQLCMVTTSKVTFTYEFDDATVVNQTSPGSTPYRASLKKMNAFGCNISGVCDISDFQVLKGDADGEVAVIYKFEVALPMADGGGFWLSAVWFENLEIEQQKFGVVTFSGQLRGDGVPTWTAATV